MVTACNLEVLWRRTTQRERVEVLLVCVLSGKSIVPAYLQDGGSAAPYFECVKKVLSFTFTFHEIIIISSPIFISFSLCLHYQARHFREKFLTSGAMSAAQAVDRKLAVLPMIFILLHVWTSVLCVEQVRHMLRDDSSDYNAAKLSYQILHFLQVRLLIKADIFAHQWTHNTPVFECFCSPNASPQNQQK